MASRGAAKRGTPARGGSTRGRLNRPEMAKVLLTVEEVAHKLSVGRNAVYGLMNRGELGYVTVGRVRRVPVEAIDEFVANARANARANANSGVGRGVASGVASGVARTGRRSAVA